MLTVSPKKVSLGCFVLGLTLLSPHFLTMTFGQSSNQISLLPKDAKPYGISYEDHVKNYWKLMLSLPIDKNPMEEKSTVGCAYAQNLSNTSIFYFPGGFAGVSQRTCKIPAGLGVFIPIITVEASQAESPKSTITDLHQIAKNDQDHVTSLYLKINEKEFTEDELRKFRTHTSDFNVVFPNNAIFGAAAGPSVAVADGYYVITPPLNTGNYTINYKGSLTCLGPDCLEPNFVAEGTLKLIVE